jgi:hypothetical protein
VSAGEPAGYAHPGYAASLKAFGTPLRLPACGGSVLVRPVPGGGDKDAMGCYPIFACPDWRRLEEDLDALMGELVTFAAVPDPFAPADEAWLRRAFRDRVVPFKDHFVADLSGAGRDGVSRHHRYYAGRALARVEVEEAPDPVRHLDEWEALYAALRSRHGLRGIKAFSRDAFEAQLRLPGLVMLRARHEGETVAAHLWFVQGEVVYSHLAAADERGYALGAAYAIYWRTFDLFEGRARTIDFGAGAGIGDDDADGLARFKRGWTKHTRTAWFCGRVLDPERYAKILRERGLGEAGYFPAYRAGEFA